MSTNRISPRAEARVCGVLYLLNMLTGIAAMVLLSRKMQGAGDIMNLIAAVLYTGVTLLLWHLFCRVQAWISSVAALVSLLGCWLPLARFQALDLPDPRHRFHLLRSVLSSDRVSDPEINIDV